MTALGTRLRLLTIDVLSRKTVGSYYRFLAKSQWWSASDLRDLQIAKLRLLLGHCERHVPFYGDIIRRRGIVPERVDHLDVLQEFPVIDKATIKENLPAFRSAPNASLGLIRMQSTGGTTGDPLRFPKNAGVRSAAQAAMLRFHDWMGIAPGDRKLVLWGAPTVTASRLRRFRTALQARVLRTRQIDAFALSRQALPGIIELLRRYQPRLVHGYCQSLVDLARWILAEGVTVPVRAVSTTVEPLFDEHRRVLEAAFGCPAFDQYGCGEAEAIAMECPAHSGLHVTDERVVLELGEGGEVIVTDLDNLAFPFIRYRNGDLAVAADGDCRCGRHTRRLSRIIGRTGDAIVGLGGQRLHPEFFTHLINETGIAAARDLRRYQVVQETPRRLVWKLVSRPLTPADERRLVQALRDHLGEIEIAIQIVDDIPASASGKFRYVVNRS